MEIRIEADHGALKRLIQPTLGFQSMKTAYATVKGFEVMRMFKKGQFTDAIVKGGLRAGGPLLPMCILMVMMAEVASVIFGQSASADTPVCGRIPPGPRLEARTWSAAPTPRL